MECKASPNILDNHGYTGLHLAIARDVPVCVEMLLYFGADADARNGDRMSPLELAVQQGHDECIYALLEGGADAKSLGGRRKDDVADFYQMRRHCKNALLVLWGVLRRRCHVSRDAVNLITSALWRTRRNHAWLRIREPAKSSKPIPAPKEQSKSSKPCNHKCADKATCGHACCKK